MKENKLYMDCKTESLKKYLTAESLKKYLTPENIKEKNVSSR
jgi:hypothetical protein